MISFKANIFFLVSPPVVIEIVVVVVPPEAVFEVVWVVDVSLETSGAKLTIFKIVSWLTEIASPAK